MGLDVDPLRCKANPEYPMSFFWAAPGGILEESVELFVVSDSELDVSWDDSCLLGILGGVTGELEDLSGEVLKDGSEIDWGTGTDSVGVLSLLKESGDSSDWELKSDSSGLGDRFTGGGLSFSSSSPM